MDININNLQKWVEEKKILEKAIRQGKRYLREYAQEEPESFKRDLTVDAQAVDKVEFTFYRFDLSSVNPEFDINPSNYISVFIELSMNKDVLAYYKCILDLEGNIFDDYLKDKYYC